MVVDPSCCLLFNQANKKIEDAKLARDFQTTLQEFQKVQQLASERESTYTPASTSSPLPTRSIILCIIVQKYIHWYNSNCGYFFYWLPSFSASTNFVFVNSSGAGEESVEVDLESRPFIGEQKRWSLKHFSYFPGPIEFCLIFYLIIVIYKQYASLWGRDAYFIFTLFNSWLWSCFLDHWNKTTGKRYFCWIMNYPSMRLWLMKEIRVSKR